MQKVQKWSQQIPKPQPPNSNVVFSCTFNTDGSLLFVVISDILVVYNAQNGEVVTKPTKAAKQPINCVAFAKDGHTFATASNDRTCVIWRFNMQNQKKIQPVLKLTQNDQIITLSFNPLTHELFSGGVSDFALYTPGKNQIPKEKFKEKIMCSAWSPDGQTIAFGGVNGTVALRHRNLDEKNEIKLQAPAWCMEWSPITTEHQNTYLLVGCWDQTFYYFDSEGERRQKISERHLPCNPISVNFHSSGEYFLMTGTDKKVSMYSRDLGFLTDITTLNDWSWSSKFRPKTSEIAITTNSGLIMMHQLCRKTVFSCHHDLYAHRDNFTDVIIENIVLNQKLRVKCKELVKMISIFKDKLAVLQNERLLIYVASEEGLKYSPYRKITKKFDCDTMQILNSHVLFTKDNKIQVFNFLGELEREWMLEAKVTFLKTIGGPPKREHALVGLANGQVLKLFVDNSFPIQLYRSSVSIIGCDINVTKKKLAILDLNKNLVGFDLITQTQLFQQVNVSSFSWNSELEDTIAYSSGGTISVKTGSMPALNQKSDAKIIGFEGFQLFILKDNHITVMDISQSSTLVKFVEKKDFQTAYKLACLGVPQNDLRFLGVQALLNNDFEIAEKCFIRLKDLPFIELAKKYSDDHKSNKKINSDVLRAQVLAFQGKYQQSASCFIKAGRTDEAIQLFCELKRFDEAQRFIRMSPGNDNKEVMSNLLVQQAEWATANGDWKQAAQLYIAGKNYRKAIDIYLKENYLDGLIEVCRIVDKDGNEGILTNCASTFKKNKQHGYAKEVYLKMGDMKSLMLLHIELEKWEQAFLLGKHNKELLQFAKLPYANYLLKNGSYEEALRAFKKINRMDLTQNLLSSLCQNAVNEKRLVDAARLYMSMAVQQLKLVKDLKNTNQEDLQRVKKYKQFRSIAKIYYVYNFIAQFVETPFFTSSEAALYTILNACRFLITQIPKFKLPFVNSSYIYYSLAKVSSRLEGYKTARACYEKLSQLVVQSKWVEEMQLGNLTVRSKPFSDKETILPTCARCSMVNPLISENNSCYNCKQPFIMSLMSFEVLPLIQFKPAKGINHSKVIELINSEKKNVKAKRPSKNNDGWKQSVGVNEQVLSNQKQNVNQYVSHALKERVNETLQNQQVQVEFIPVVLTAQDLAELDTECIYFLDLRKINPTQQIRYFVNMVPQILLKCCGECGMFFLLDEYQFQFIQTKRCPFCNGQQKRSGRTKDIFDP